MDVAGLTETSPESKNIVQCHNPEDLSPLRNEGLQYRAFLLFVLSIKFIRNARTTLSNTWAIK